MKEAIVKVKVIWRPTVLPKAHAQWDQKPNEGTVRVKKIAINNNVLCILGATAAEHNSA